MPRAIVCYCNYPILLTKVSLFQSPRSHAPTFFTRFRLQELVILKYSAQFSQNMGNHVAKALAGLLVLLLSASVVSAYAQMPPGMQEVSGKYTNSDVGVEVTFPAGWSGFEITGSFGTLVATSPGGMSESDPTTMKTINLMIVEKSEDLDPSDPGSFSNDVENCNAPSFVSRTVAGVQGVETTVECPETSQTYSVVLVETSSHFVLVMYMAPTSEFDSASGSFESTVDSLKVNGAVNTQIPSEMSDGTPSSDDNTGGQTESPNTNVMSVNVEGSPIDVSVTSASTISDFEIDEQNKMLSFKTSGTGTETVIAVGSVLEGPYNVMVDGTTTQVTQSQENGVTTISVPHSSGAHDVTITGTQVVPEFPVALIIMVAGMAGALAAVRWAKLIPGKL